MDPRSPFEPIERSMHADKQAEILDADATRARLERYVSELEGVEQASSGQLERDELLELHIVLNKGRMALRKADDSELFAALRYVRRWRRGFVKRLRARQSGTLDEVRLLA